VGTFLEQIRQLRPGWRDLIEIALVAYLFYRALLLLQRSRAVQILLGVAMLAVSYAVAAALKFEMITYLLALVVPYGVVTLLIVFQPELRGALARLGKSRVTRFFRRLEDGEVAEEIADALERLSRSGIGAIVAIEREMDLGEFVESGSAMHARVSADLLATIFTPYSPLHDGAVIIRGDVIVGAGCILPLSQAPLSDRSLGTRHRAAIGLSEETDATVIVVSEESSAISVATHGRFMRALSHSQLRDVLAGRLPRTTAEAPIAELRA
jgi:diadenylate cyclase